MSAAVSGAVLAHGVGTRADLPLPVRYAALGAGLAVLVSAAGLVALWRESRLAGDRAGRPLADRLTRLLDSRVLRVLVQGLFVDLALLVVAVGLAGPREIALNLAPWVLYVWFWVGLVPVSLLLGRFWRYVNPLRAIHIGLSTVLGRRPENGADLSPRVGLWPAAAVLAVFTWVELVYPDRADPSFVALFLLAYAAYVLAGAVRYGDRWFEQADGFEVWSSLVARLSPWGRRADGRLVVRNPLDNLDGQPALPGLAAVVVVLIGATAFDGLTRTVWWDTGFGGDGPLAGTLAWAACIAVVAVGYVLATRLAVAGAGVDAPPAGLMPGAFAHSLVPIAVGYWFAHYFSLFVFDGQVPTILASDPFGSGSNLFGTAGRRVDYTVVSPRVISVVQVGSIVLGHVLAVVLAHDRAVRVLPRRHAVRGQVPLLVVMVGLTVGAVLLLLGG